MKKVWLWSVPAVAVVGLVVYSEATRPAWEAAQKAEQAETLRVSLVTAQAEKHRKDEEEAARRTPEARKAYATELEGLLLDGRMNFTVQAEGKEADVLRIEWILLSKVTVRDFTKGGLVEQAKSRGFRKMIMTNGSKYRTGDEWTWNLT